MKLKLILAIVVITPTIVMAQAMVTDKPVIAPPAVPEKIKPNQPVDPKKGMGAFSVNTNVGSERDIKIESTKPGSKAPVVNK